MYMANVKQEGSSVCAYSPGGSLMWVHNGRLVSWTAREAAVEVGGRIYIYDATGAQVG